MGDKAGAAQRYDSGAIAFHWTVAAFILFLGVLGLLFDDMPKPMRPFWINVHGSVGLVYLALVVARLAWRIGHPPPRLPADVGEFSRRTSADAPFAIRLDGAHPCRRNYRLCLAWQIV